MAHFHQHGSQDSVVAHGAIGWVCTRHMQWFVNHCDHCAVERVEARKIQALENPSQDPSRCSAFTLQGTQCRHAVQAGRRKYCGIHGK